MGRDVTQSAFSREDRIRYRRKIRQSLEVLTVLLDGDRFGGESLTSGFEIEINLVDVTGQPAMCNAEVLADLADTSFQTELGQFNLENNIQPRSVGGESLATYEREIHTNLLHADKRAGRIGVQLMLIGILPTLTPAHTVLANMSANPRYALLNDEMTSAREERFRLDVRGRERLLIRTDSIVPEAACTSTQFHLRVTPDQFPSYWNAAQAIAAIQVGVGANSPYLFGRRLWDETRITLFEQAIDTRTEELKAQGVRPRVWFGERWITSILDLFEENVRYFPPLLPILDGEDPGATLRSGGTPRLPELRLHNGTVYRWNRPVYDVVLDRPHLRVENRVLPSGPTVADLMANAALYFGLVRTLAEQERPIWTRLTFATAQENFYAAARHGIGARLRWPGYGEIPLTELVTRSLLPLADAGLERFGVTSEIRGRLLGIIEGRCAARQNGAVWQSATVEHFERTLNFDRMTAIREMLSRYRDGLYHNEPVHRWAVPGGVRQGVTL